MYRYLCPRVRRMVRRPRRCTGLAGRTVPRACPRRPLAAGAAARVATRSGRCESHRNVVLPAWHMACTLCLSSDSTQSWFSGARRVGGSTSPCGRLANLGRHVAQPVRHGRGDVEPPRPAAPGECLPRRALRGPYMPHLCPAARGRAGHREPRGCRAQPALPRPPRPLPQPRPPTRPPARQRPPPPQPRRPRAPSSASMAVLGLSRILK